MIEQHEGKQSEVLLLLVTAIIQGDIIVERTDGKISLSCNNLGMKKTLATALCNNELSDEDKFFINHSAAMQQRRRNKVSERNTAHRPLPQSAQERRSTFKVVS